jgi:hypothetical protein
MSHVVTQHRTPTQFDPQNSTPKLLFSRFPPSDRPGGISLFETTPCASTSLGLGLPSCYRSVFLLGMGVRKANLAAGGKGWCLKSFGLVVAFQPIFDEGPDFRPPRSPSLLTLEEGRAKAPLPKPKTHFVAC